jgi:putative transcriptional regulator
MSSLVLVLGLGSIATMGASDLRGGSLGLATVGGATTRPARGRLLVASAELRDPNFARSVVLLLAYGAEGALGIVVNRPTPVKLSKLLPDIAGLAKRADTVWMGGPVMPRTILLLVRSKNSPGGGEQIVGDVHMLSRPEAVRRELDADSSPRRLRAYAGSAGWAAGQLDAELARGDWTVVPGGTALVFSDDPDRLWPTLAERAEGQWTRAPGSPP